ncbi:hypothetical protein ACHAWU_008822 [Discostella pseudostelligera]|uniref:Uncharacterized protein n=1 Tax=Discostella pseudostelligera TaxID=259834 RepID=A0ABD3MZU5_9STRA
MNALISTTICTLLLAIPVHYEVFAFAPSSSKSPLHRSSSQSLLFSPHTNIISDLPFLISDAIDAVADVSATAASDTESGSSSSFMPSYSNASYYTTLALYVASFPGLWSQIKRSTTAKVKRKTYVRDGDLIFHLLQQHSYDSPGEATEGGKELRQQAGEIMAYMKANNYEVAEAGETIVFRGLVARSTSQAFFLTFCTAIGMASLALVLQIQFQDLVLPGIGAPNWFLLVLLSPYAGIYYWRSGDRVDDMKIKLATNDDDTMNEITIEGNDEEIERIWRTLNLQEKGMVRVEGIMG